METGFITPIQLWGSLAETGKTAQTENSSAGIFKGIFENAVKDVTDTQKELEQQQYLLSTGQIDDVHTVTIAASEAQLSVDMLVQLRNKAVESYNELMRISL
ncbi:flagellar hook-basal body complex protein FliE [Faecalicatena contorta]|jgi:flagellar hook-basal body complex protein FliE|uniref:Flagellar hook-basal body complex protein FliE n=1 Tax=Faecalicatena contorta TaxID=39482 RepID=A0A316A6P1_9FIRM|nr:flagellar hook-basal body complex protein FliE [Faecalicatena contorta]MBA4698895.1 flagellar hook-basal body complex protein FliE [Ruminococcus sp.]PWJ52484.1 flagellar hook-basal body complex protein FliE [Faecalicatena contorta]SUQ12762.1 flagellar hook-basal body complex protein FliE [Faecalicatena contorta]